jgi:hypothetical protein
MSEQTCRVCNITKPFSEYHFRKENSKYRTDCKECRCKEEAAKRYNVTVGFIEKLKEDQHNKCAICFTSAADIQHKAFTSNPLVIDHSHSTGQVRGLLCPTCNCMLGHAKDDIQILLNAIQYLQK